MFFPLPAFAQAEFEQPDVGGRQRQAVFGRGASDALLQFGWNANVALNAYRGIHKPQCTTFAPQPCERKERWKNHQARNDSDSACRESTCLRKLRSY